MINQLMLRTMGGSCMTQDMHALTVIDPMMGSYARACMQTKYKVNHDGCMHRL